MMVKLLYSLCLFTVLLPSVCRSDEHPPLWYYTYVDLEQDELSTEEDLTNYGVDDAIALMKKLKENNYSVIVLASPGLSYLPDLRQPDSLIAKNLIKLNRAAERNGIEIIPEIMPVGSSGSILENDRNMIEALAVKNCKYKVQLQGKDLVAVVADSANKVSAGCFEELKDQGDTKKYFYFDTEDEGSQVALLPAVRSDPDGNSGNVLLFDAAQVGPSSTGYFTLGTYAPPSPYAINLKPFHQYRISFRLRTEGIDLEDKNSGLYTSFVVDDPIYGERELHHVGLALTAVAPSRQIEDFTIQPSQPWKEYTIAVNSLNYRNARFWFGGSFSAGKLWVDDICVKQTEAVNLVRREDDLGTLLNEGLPIQVCTSDGRPYREGQHFRNWDDALVRENGYKHSQEPIKIRIIRGAGIKNGDVLDVSYFHAQLYNEEPHRISVSLQHPKVLTWFREQVKLIDGYIKPKRWAINHDEVRMGGHDPLTNGESLAKLLGRNLRECNRIIKEESQHSKTIVFSDMYDPGHNALHATHKDSYYPLVNGSFFGSWDYLPRNVTIWNWSMGEMRAGDFDGRVARSFRHFDRINLPQVVGGYYDVSPEVSVGQEAKHLFEIARRNGKVTGLCFYTTKRNTSHIGTFAKAADDAWEEDISDENVPASQR